MATIDVQEFAASPEALALRVDSSDLPGLLSKRLEVPEGAIALVSLADGPTRLLAGGEVAQGAFRALLVKPGEHALSFQVDGLKTRRGRETRAGIEVLLRLPEKELQLRAFLKGLLSSDAYVSVATLRAHLTPYVTDGLRSFVSERSAEELLTEDPRADLEARLQKELEPALFAAGIELREVRHPSFYCEEFEALRRQRRAMQEREEEIARSERLQEMKARLERNEHLKRHEVEEFAKVLQYQGVLKELSLREDLDRRRQDAQMRRFEAISNQVGNDELKALIFLLEDDRMKAQLIEQLIERDMSEEQLRAKRENEVERRLEERLASFAKKLESVVGDRTIRVQKGGTRVRRAIAVLGKQALAFDVGTNVRREAPKEVYDLGAGSLGYIRSVRGVHTRTGRTILLGAQSGVYALPEQGRAGDRRELPFPQAPDGQGGVNAAAYYDGYVYATHSEMGLWRFDLDGLVRPEPLFREITRGREATRGVEVTPRGELFFASGPDIYRYDLVRETGPTVFRGIEDGITTFLTTPHQVFAGTRGGRVLCWSLGDPGSPRELGIRKANPIYMLRQAELYGGLHLLVGAKEHGLTAVSIEDGRSFDYRGPEQIRWVDGASDFVVGVTRGGYALHVWKADRLEQPEIVIHVADRVQDLVVLKEPFAESDA